MKMFLRSLLLIAALVVLRASAWVTLTLTRPALVNLPQHIHTMIIVDRTLPANVKKNRVESVLTGETPHEDEQAVEQVINGVISIVNNGQRMRVIRTTEKFVGGTDGKTFPQAMSWTVINNLCQKYKADAALVLETFDSDYILTHGTAKIQKNADGTPSLAFSAQGIGTVNLGFRVYDPSQKVISDEFLFNHEARWNAGGNTVADAIQGLMNKTEAVKQVSYDAGQLYGKRITPTYYRVTRYFYNKPKRNKKLTEGVRKSKVADWQGAIDSWQEAMKIAKKRKQRGRIAYDIAVGYEVLGDLDKALDWASKAYVDYKEKWADDYVRQLKNRINEEAVVREQLGMDK